jgi:hypothetical protein
MLFWRCALLLAPCCPHCNPSLPHCAIRALSSSQHESQQSNPGARSSCALRLLRPEGDHRSKRCLSLPAGKLHAHQLPDGRTERAPACFSLHKQLTHACARANLSPLAGRLLPKKLPVGMHVMCPLCLLTCACMHADSSPSAGKLHAQEAS